MLLVDSALADLDVLSLIEPLQLSPVLMKILATIVVTACLTRFGEKRLTIHRPILKTSKPQLLPTLRISTKLQMSCLSSKRASNSNSPLPYR